jgi:aspartate/tyrosine/aromatic aminotransferase
MLHDAFKVASSRHATARAVTGSGANCNATSALKTAKQRKAVVHHIIGIVLS